MRFVLFLLIGIGLVLVAGAALAGPPDDHGVTVLRGSSAPPPPPAPEPYPEPTIIQREIVYAPYPDYASPGFILPGFGFVVRTPHRPFHPVVPSTTVPDGWPLFKTPTRR